MKSLIKAKLLLMLWLVILPGCTTTPITGRKQFIVVPESIINSMSYQEYNNFLAENKLSQNLQHTQMVKDVGSNIQKAVDQYCAQNYMYERIRGYQWEFNLVEDPNVNAWAMPGGKVVVYSGMIPVAQDEAGLAVVMGHEIAHVFARHGSERMSQGLLAEFGSIALSTALKTHPEKTRELFMQAYGIGTQVGYLLRYSRIHENEADHLGLIFMAMAGYNPEEAVDFWQRMDEKSKGAQPPEFLSTHPAHDTRIQNIKSHLPEAMRYYQKKINYSN